MLRTSIIVISLVLAATVLAANVHFKHGHPLFTDTGLSLESSGALAGIGNGDLLLILSATANVTATCTNPGGHQPPGHNPAPVTVTGTESIPASETKNGSTSFDVFTDGPVTPIPGAPDCPNRHWTEDITSAAFTSATLTVQQPPGVTVLTLSCTFSPPTADGPIASVTCS